jgi:hypothetical protein
MDKPELLPRDSAAEPVSRWFPRDKPAWKRPGSRIIVFGCFGLGGALWLLSQFFQLRGFVNVLASRICLVGIVISLAVPLWVWVWNLRKLRFVTGLSLTVLLIIGAVFSDRITLPSPKSIIGQGTPTPSPLDTRTSGSAMLFEPDGGWMESWESIGTNLRVVARTSPLLPYRLHLHLMLVIRANNDLVDEMEDARIEKSALYSVNENRVEMEMSMSQALLARVYPDKIVRISLVLLPNPLVPDQINTLGDVERLGGKILVTNGIALHVATVPPPSAPTSSRIAPESTLAQSTESAPGGLPASNQLATVQAPIIQANSGGCNQQVVGGNNNTNNCAPPERHLTQKQKDGLIALAQQIPKDCLVFFGSGDGAEPKAYAKEMHDLWATVGTTRNPGFIFSWHPKGIYFEVKSPDEPCAPYGLQLAKGMKDLGFATAGAIQNPAISNDKEIQVLVGDP